MQRKILYVITKGNFGGAQRYVFDVATHLTRERFLPTVACGEPGRLLEKLRTAGIRTIVVPSLSRDVSFLRDARSFLSLLRLFRLERPHIVHLNSSKAAALGTLAARLAGVPRVVVTIHGWPFLEKRSPLWRLFVKLASYATSLLAHAVIVISKHDLEIALRWPLVGKKLTHIYHGIAPLRLGSGESIRAAFPPGARIVGTVGELTANKNQSELILRALREPDICVAIVGEGELGSALSESIRANGLQSRVKLFGFVPAEEVLRGFDVFALPSLKEGLPYVLIEAKLAGLPIDANLVGGVAEIIAGDPQEFLLEKMLQKTLEVYQD